MIYLGILIGLVAGILIHKYWDDITNFVSGLGDRLPDAETFAEKIPGILAWAKKNALVLVLIGIFLAIVVVNVIPKAPEIPVVKIGQPIEMKDACGAKVIVTVTEQDVARGSIIIGSIQPEGDKKDCRRILNLGTK